MMKISFGLIPIILLFVGICVAAVSPIGDESMAEDSTGDPQPVLMSSEPG